MLLADIHVPTGLHVAVTFPAVLKTKTTRLCNDLQVDQNLTEALHLFYAIDLDERTKLRAWLKDEFVPFIR